MKFQTTLKEIRSYNPCGSRWNKLLRGLDTNDMETKVTLLEILNINGIKDAFWALRLFKFKDYYTVIVKVLESIQHLMKDERSIVIIKGIDDYYCGKITIEEFKKIRKAAAAYAVVANDDAAAYTAAYAAAAATADAAADTDTAAAACIAYAAAATAADTAREEQWNKTEIILRKFLT